MLLDIFKSTVNTVNPGLKDECIIGPNPNVATL